MCIYMEDRITDACLPPTRAAVSARVCVLVWAHKLPHRNVRAHSVDVDCVSFGRYSNKRLRSTRTSARGTPRVSPRCTRYAPLSADTLSRSGRRGRCARQNCRCAWCAHHICVCVCVCVCLCVCVCVCVCVYNICVSILYSRLGSM